MCHIVDFILFFITLSYVSTILKCHIFISPWMCHIVDFILFFITLSYVSTILKCHIFITPWMCHIVDFILFFITPCIHNTEMPYRWFNPLISPLRRGQKGVASTVRLWQYLVRQENIQEVFVRYIFARKRPAPEPQGGSYEPTGKGFVLRLCPKL